MVKRKRKMKLKKNFNIWDILIIIVILGAGSYLLLKDGFQGLLDTFIKSIFFAFVVSFVIRFFKMRANR